MKPTLFYCLSILLLICSIGSYGQNYIDEIYDEINITDSVVYGENYTIEPILSGGASMPQVLPLFMDVYEPEGNENTDRPLIIILHSGSYLPAIANQTPYGGFLGLLDGQKDSAVVAIAQKMTRRGYVVAAMSYRRGWNAVIPDEIELQKGIFEASLRVTQDIHTCIRWFKKNVAENGNEFGIDTEKITVIGDDASTYAAANAAYLNSLEQSFIDKFLDPRGDEPVPYIDTLLFGDVFGKRAAGLNVANHPDYESSNEDIKIVIGKTGGLAEVSWMDEGEAAYIGIQNINEFDTIGIRTEFVQPGNFAILVDAAFADTLTYIADSLGNNDKLNEFEHNDPISQVARERSGGTSGLLVTNTPIREGTVNCIPNFPEPYVRNIFPWRWYNEEVFIALLQQIGGITQTEAEIVNCQLKLRDPNDVVLSKSYVDTITQYIAPRIASCFGLDTISTSLDNQLSKELGLQVFPNPTTDQLNITAESQIRSVELFSIQGQMVYERNNLNRSGFQINDPNLPPGIYTLRMTFDEGIVRKKILWQ